ncbi:hypothetical protein DEU56DRAFT_329806 [Suillus clintonianus]|uniref:uncharacterized protein n=1 Tax=Suillus clintonianus TaxID=1904413 RepID=UPI001B860140|nr:uncharacterized protein DEU56DRAFT_329806 [Suillus clintonianus]KAG2138959.1 hypothetical protein DEU56DRAFT_329806 [Suillus clintonianus]
MNEYPSSSTYVRCPDRRLASFIADKGISARLVPQVHRAMWMFKTCFRVCPVRSATTPRWYSSTIVELAGCRGLGYSMRHRFVLPEHDVDWQKCLADRRSPGHRYRHHSSCPSVHLTWLLYSRYALVTSSPAGHAYPTALLPFFLHHINIRSVEPSSGDLFSDRRRSKYKSSLIDDTALRHREVYKLCATEIAEADTIYTSSTSALPWSVISMVDGNK